MNWDELFMRHVYLIAAKSKDASTKIGAVAVKDKQIVCAGFNGFGRGVLDPADNDRITDLTLAKFGISREQLLLRKERPAKYYYTAHAERNVCYQAARHGIALKGAILYTQALPCPDCALAIIQSGIIEIRTHKQWPIMSNWEEKQKFSFQMLKETGIPLIELDMKLNIKGFLSDKEIEV